MSEEERKFKLVSMMRVKNEERWLGESIRSQAGLVDKIIVLDDGSTDNTAEICLARPELIEYHRQEEAVIDEARDKNRLLQWVLREGADWVLALDGDEVLEDLAPDTICREISLLDPDDPQFTVFSFHFLYMWNKTGYFRVEPGIYSNFWQPRLFTLHGQKLSNLTFKPSPHGANFHCGSIPANLRVIPRKLDVKVKHYGYLDPVRRQEKYDWYCLHDPEKAAGGYYEHLTSEEGMVLARWQERTQALSSSFVKEAPYYQAERPEIVELVPVEADKILDIGCGCGFLGKTLKERNPGTSVTGIELDISAGRAAAELLDQVIIGNIEEMSLPFAGKEFDCIIMADVLEHLRDHWQVLLKVRRYLAEDGLLIISIPNVRNLAVIAGLLRGEWRYCQAGILDATHLRFFTLKEFKRTLAELGYRLIDISLVEDPGIDSLCLNEGEGYREVCSSFEWNQLDEETVAELHTVQFLLRAGPDNRLKRAAQRSLTSIIIPVYNNLNKTRLCLESVLSHTPEPRELIIIDNGSAEATREYLDWLSSRENCVLLRNEENRGYPRACNQGILQAEGKQLVFLNNDVLVSDNWLSHLLDHLERPDHPEKEGDAGGKRAGSKGDAGGKRAEGSKGDAEGKKRAEGDKGGKEKGIGVVGACSNYTGGIQQVRPTYRELSGFYQFSREYYWEHRGEYLLTYRLGGFCLLVKREVIEEIGGFDERFFPGNYEDDDFCLRAAAAGFKVIAAGDVFLHHFGSSTFKKQADDYRQFMADNWEKFKIKWGLDPGLRSPEGINYPLLAAENNSKEQYYLSPEEQFHS